MENLALHLVEITVCADTPDDYDKLALALRSRAADDNSFAYSLDSERRRFTLKGQDDSKLSAMLDILKRTYNVDANIGAPQVAYRERLTKKTEIDYTHKKQTGGTGQFARVKIIFEPNEAGKGNEFESKIVGGAVPKEYIPGVEKGINSVMGCGILAGFPIVDLKATLIDGAFHDVDSSVLAFEIASRAAFREALQKGQSVLLEPIMKVEVVTPEEYAGLVIGDLNSRRGQIQVQDMRGNAVVVDAMAPLANMFGYDNRLRSLTQGRANYMMRLSHYAAVEEAPDPDGRFPPAVGMRLKPLLRNGTMS